MIERENACQTAPENATDEAVVGLGCQTADHTW